MPCPVLDVGIASYIDPLQEHPEPLVETTHGAGSLLIAIEDVRDNLLCSDQGQLYIFRTFRLPTIFPK
jgi:hypothetical protein